MARSSTCTVAVQRAGVGDLSELTGPLVHLRARFEWRKPSALSPKKYVLHAEVLARLIVARVVDGSSSGDPGYGIGYPFATLGHLRHIVTGTGMFDPV